MGFYIFLALISLCASIKVRDLPGFYYSKDCIYNLTLLNDSTFNYNNSIGYKKNVSKGTWRIYGEKLLILNSLYRDLLNTPVKVFESKSQEGKDSLFFKINSKFVEDSNCFYVIIINDSIEVVSNKPFIRSHTVGVINKIKLYYACPNYNGVPYQIRDTVGTEVYNIKDPNLNVFEFYWNCNDELFYYEVFNYDTIDIKNKHLYFRQKDAILIKKK